VVTAQSCVASQAFVHGCGPQLIHDPHPQLHQSMPMPKQLPQIPILRTGDPDSRKTIFPQQLQHKLGILAVVLLLPDSLGLDLRRIAKPHLDTQFRGNRSNQRACPVASIPTRRLTPHRFRSR
jgi:hypothetical protein